MSTKRLVFKVSHGLAVTGLTLAVGACEQPEPKFTVNPVGETSGLPPIENETETPATSPDAGNATPKPASGSAEQEKDAAPDPPKK